MAKLSQQLEYFIAKKITEDSDWRNVQVILSGHDVPAKVNTRSWSTFVSARRSRLQPQRPSLSLRSRCRSHHAGSPQSRPALLSAS